MKFLIDTNVYVAFFKDAGQVKNKFQLAQKIYVPFIVVAELRSGFLNGSKPAENERQLNIFINAERVEVIFADEQTTHHYARLYYQLRKQGTPIPINDVWIAALAIQYNLPLFTFDSDFNHLPQLLKVA